MLVDGCRMFTDFITIVHWTNITLALPMSEGRGHPKINIGWSYCVPKTALQSHVSPTADWSVLAGYYGLSNTISVLRCYRQQVIPEINVKQSAPAPSTKMLVTLEEMYLRAA